MRGLIVVTLATSLFATATPALCSGPAYLVYAGPYSSSPPSAFGHLFIVLSDDSDTPIMLWDVISFTAETYGAGPLRYLAVGITGGFLGRYQQLKFHQKARDYQYIDDRDLWFMKLNVTARQQARIAYFLHESTDQWYPYTFFKRNCAFYIQELLATVTGVIEQPSGTVSPIEVFQTVSKSSLAGPCYHRPSTSKRLRDAAQHVSAQARSTLQSTDWRTAAADTAWISSLDHNDRLFVLDYLKWKSRHYTLPISSPTQQGLELLRVLNAQAVKHRTSHVENLPGHQIPLPGFHSYPKLELAIQSYSGDKQRVHLRYRPALHGHTDPWTGHRPVNTIEILSVALSHPFRGSSTRIDEITLFSQRSIQPSTWISPQTSWLLEAATLRGGIFGPDVLNSHLKMGYGFSRELLPESCIYILGTGAIIGQFGVGQMIAPGFEAGAITYGPHHWRCGIRYFQERNLSKLTQLHERLSFWIHYDIGANWGTTYSIDIDTTQTKSVFALSWFP